MQASASITRRRSPNRRSRWTELVNRLIHDEANISIPADPDVEEICEEVRIEQALGHSFSFTGIQIA
jgi:hypothetical protein